VVEEMWIIALLEHCKFVCEWLKDLGFKDVEMWMGFLVLLEYCGMHISRAQGQYMMVLEK
jgi:hypothetical protein